MIFGRPGSGKSTFAYTLGQKIGLPLYHLDKYFFQSHWQERDEQDFMRLQNKMVQSQEWIIDGNSTRSLETRWARADLVLYFNFPKTLCLYRIIKRRLQKNRGLDDRADQCPEILRWRLLWYMWSFESRVAPLLQTYQEKYPHVTFMEICSDKAARAVKSLLEMPSEILS